MSWSKVKKGYKPLGWWYHKLMCEFWYEVRDFNGDLNYYHHLNIMIKKYKINIYGEEV